MFNKLSGLNFHSQYFLVGMLLAIIGTALFSLKSIFIKLAYAEGLDADSVLMLRMAIALPIYLMIIAWLIKRQPIQPSLIKRKILIILFLGFIGYFLSSWLDLKGLETISAQLERLTLFTYPIWVAILGALFLKTPLTKKVGIAILLSYVGLWVVFSAEMSVGGNDIVWGTFWVMLSAFTFSIYVLLSKPVMAKIGSLWFTSLAMSISSLLVLIYFFSLVNPADLIITTKAWLWLGLLAIFSTVIPSFMVAEAIHRIGGTQTGIIGMLGPIFTLVLAVWILNEPFGWSHIIGLSLVLSGIFILSIKK